MKALTDISTDVLEWRAAEPPGAAFELTSSEGLHATMTWSLADTFARLETPEGTWTFLRVGVLGKHVTIREEGSHANLAEFHPHTFTKGRLDFRDGASFNWTHLPHSLGWAFQDLEGAELLRLQPWPEPAGSLERGLILGRVILNGQGVTRWRDAFLAGLGWYILLLAKHDEKVQEGALAGANLI